MAKDYDFSKQVAGIKVPVLVVAGDADIFPPSHAVELFGLLGEGQRDGNWDGSGKPVSRLAIRPGRTHYDVFAAPELARSSPRSWILPLVLDARECPRFSRLPPAGGRLLHAYIKPVTVAWGPLAHQAGFHELSQSALLGNVNSLISGVAINYTFSRIPAANG